MTETTFLLAINWCDENGKPERAECIRLRLQIRDLLTTASSVDRMEELLPECKSYKLDRDLAKGTP